jgi:hypothetical protein
MKNIKGIKGEISYKEGKEMKMINNFNNLISIEDNDYILDTENHIDNESQEIDLNSINKTFTFKEKINRKI